MPTELRHICQRETRPQRIHRHTMSRVASSSPTLQQRAFFFFFFSSGLSLSLPVARSETMNAWQSSALRTLESAGAMFCCAGVPSPAGGQSGRCPGRGCRAPGSRGRKKSRQPPLWQPRYAISYSRRGRMCCVSWNKPSRMDTPEDGHTEMKSPGRRSALIKASFLHSLFRSR